MSAIRFVPRAVKDRAKRLLRERGYQLAQIPDPHAFFEDLDDRFAQIWKNMPRHLSGGDIRLYTTYSAVAHVVNAGIAGDFIECGVYRGRHAMMMAETLKSLGVSNRDIYLYDTFAGQVQPSPDDYKDRNNPEASYRANLARWEKGQQTGPTKQWKVATLDEVRSNVHRTGYPNERLHFVEGDVRRTLPNDRHARLALLRLDTDWYASTKHELQCLYDKLAIGGVLIIDDYGRWRGCRKAVDEFFGTLGPRAPLLTRTDGSERVCIKTA